MATVLTQFQQKRAQRRKTSDIENLFKQYQQQISSITGEYESSYGTYKEEVANKMAPYEAATAKYKTDYSQYETDLASYRSGLSAYQEKLAKAIESPTAEVPTSEYVTTRTRGGTSILIGGQSYNVNNVPEGYTYEGGKLYKAVDPGKFEGKAPSAPGVPEMPTIDEFDATQFEEKRKLAETTFKREVGERKSARIGAVSQRGARSLLSGAKA